MDEVEGDVDLGQRKGKILTIYDCKIVLSWKGQSSPILLLCMLFH